MKPRILATVGGAVLLLNALAGCSAEGPNPSTASSSTIGQETSPLLENDDEHIEVSRVQVYTTIDQLADDSDLVVVATVTGRVHRGELLGAPTTTREVTPERILKGDVPERLLVWQFGEGVMLPELQPDTRHLLFLAEYELEEGIPTGEYVVTGVYAGDYVEAEDGSFEKFDPDSPELPETLPRDFSL